MWKLLRTAADGVADSRLMIAGLLALLSGALTAAGFSALSAICGTKFLREKNSRHQTKPEQPPRSECRLSAENLQDEFQTTVGATWPNRPIGNLTKCAGIRNMINRNTGDRDLHHASSATVDRENVSILGEGEGLAFCL